MSGRSRDEATILASAGVGGDPAYRGIAPPLWSSDTFAWDGPDNKPDFDYSRTANPNRNLVVDALAILEKAAGGVLTNSGQAAALLAILCLRKRATIIAPHDCYGGTYRLLEGLQQSGMLNAIFIDQGDDAAFQASMEREPDLLWLETPSNPLLRVVDIFARAGAARKAGALVLADNTLPTPCRQNPVLFGCDLVLHSTSKAINGHSDLIGGALLAAEMALAEELGWWANAAGLAGSAHDAWQTLRGMRTLSLRVGRQEETALAIARWLHLHPQVTEVNYPGLSGYRGADIASRQQRGPGFVLSFRLEGGESAAKAFVSAVRLIKLAASLGGFSTLICLPASMTHKGMSEEARNRACVTGDLIRLSIGLEAAEDLVADLGMGFSAARMEGT